MNLNDGIIITGELGIVLYDVNMNIEYTSYDKNLVVATGKNHIASRLAGITSSTIVSTTGIVGTIAGSGPWTGVITGMSSTTNLSIGSIITATNGVGSLGASGIYIVTNINSISSVNYTATGGTTPTAGTVTNVTTTGEGALVTHMGIGQSSNIPLTSDTGLFAQLGARQLVTAPVHIIGTNTISISSSFTGNTGTITEAGIFNASSGPYMLCRSTFSPISVISSNTIGITWTITIN